MPKKLTLATSPVRRERARAKKYSLWNAPFRRQLRGRRARHPGSNTTFNGPHVGRPRFLSLRGK